MFYCKDCRLLCEVSECGCCGRKKLKQPENSDIVYFATLESVWAGAFAELLENNGVQFLKEGFWRGARVVRFMMPNHYPEYQFFIHFGNLEKAEDLLELIKDGE